MKKPRARTEGIVIQKLENEMLIYDLITNQAFCLNKTSTLVWKLCDGNRTVLDISNEISKKMKALVSEDFVCLALEQFQKDNLLEEGSNIGNYFGNLSRREVIRKVGFASVIALPVISSLVAPRAAMAQSCVIGAGAGGINLTCAANTDCASCNCDSINGGGMACCVNGLTGNFFGEAIAPGIAIAPGGGSTCTTDAPACGALGATVCCNGGASLVTNPVCAPTTGTGCSCNP